MRSKENKPSGQYFCTSWNVVLTFFTSMVNQTCASKCPDVRAVPRVCEIEDTCSFEHSLTLLKISLIWVLSVLSRVSNHLRHRQSTLNSWQTHEAPVRLPKNSRNCSYWRIGTQWRISFINIPILEPHQYFTTELPGTPLSSSDDAII